MQWVVSTSESVSRVRRLGSVGKLEALLDGVGITAFRDRRAFRRFRIDVDEITDLSKPIQDVVRQVLKEGWTVETRMGRHTMHLDWQDKWIRTEQPFLFALEISKPPDL